MDQAAQGAPRRPPSRVGVSGADQVWHQARRSMRKHAALAGFETTNGRFLVFATHCCNAISDRRVPPRRVDKYWMRRPRGRDGIASAAEREGVKQAESDAKKPFFSRGNPAEREAATSHSNRLSCWTAWPRQYGWWQLIPNSGHQSPWEERAQRQFWISCISSPRSRTNARCSSSFACRSAITSGTFSARSGTRAIASRAR